MGDRRCEVSAGGAELPGYRMHLEQGRGRGALSVALICPDEPRNALGAALAALHDPAGPLDLDRRLGALAATAPGGAAFLVAQGRSVWVLPSETVSVRLCATDGVERLEEPQVVALRPGERVEAVAGPADGDGDAPVLARVASPGDAAVADPPPARDLAPAPAAATPRRAPRPRLPDLPRPSGKLVAGAAVVLVVVTAGLLVRSRLGGDHPPRSDAYRPPGLEERVLAALGSDSGERAPTGEESAATEMPPSEGPSADVPAAETGAAVIPFTEWSFAARGAITSSPLLHDGRILFGSRDSTLYCLDAQGGEVLWTVAAGAGIGSSPRAVRGTCVVGTYAGRVLAVALADGERLWEAPTRGRIISSPCLADARVIIGSYDHGIHAFDLARGRPAWRFDTDDAVRASPEAVDPAATVVGSTDGTLYCLATGDGALRWRQELGAPIHAAATFAPQTGRVYAGARDGTVVCCEAASGEEVWRTRLDAAVNAQPRLAGAVLLVGTGRGRLSALDPATGESVWSLSAERGFDARPVVLGDVIAAPTYDGVLHLVALADGSVLETRALGEEVFSSPAAREGGLYVGTLDGTFRALAVP